MPMPRVYNEASLDCKTTKDRLTPKNGSYNIVSGYDHDGVSNNEAYQFVRVPSALRRPGLSPSVRGMRMGHYGGCSFLNLATRR